MLKYSVVVLILIFVLLNNHTVYASDIQIRGFADIVGTQTDTRFSLHDIGNHGDGLVFDPETRLGLNLSADVGDDFVFAGQLLAKGGQYGSYELLAQWIFVTYKPNDEFAIRVGRQNNPTFLFSEQVDVGFTYLWVRLPHEVYGYYPLKSFNGLSVIHNLSVGEYNLRTQIFGGSGDVTIEKPNYIITGREDNVKGIEVSISSEKSKLHVAYIASNPEASITPPGIPIDLGTMEVFSAGTSPNFENFLIFAEGYRMLTNGLMIREVVGLYGSVAYQLNKWTPYITHSKVEDIEGTLFTDETGASLLTSQKSYMVGVNYKVNPSLILKGEYMRSEQGHVDTSKDFKANTFTGTMNIIF